MRLGAIEKNLSIFIIVLEAGDMGVEGDRLSVLRHMYLALRPHPASWPHGQVEVVDCKLFFVPQGVAGRERCTALASSTRRHTRHAGARSQPPFFPATGHRTAVAGRPGARSSCSRSLCAVLASWPWQCNVVHFVPLQFIFTWAIYSAASRGGAGRGELRVL